jgi:hypothetical protein
VKIANSTGLRPTALVPPTRHTKNRKNFADRYAAGVAKAATVRNLLNNGRCCCPGYMPDGTPCGRCQPVSSWQPVAAGQQYPCNREAHTFDHLDDNQRASLTKDGWDLSTCIPGCNGACDAVNYATRRSKDKAEANKPSKLFSVKALTVPIMQRHTLCRTRPSCDVCHRRIGGWRTSAAADKIAANKDMLSRMAAS